MYFPGFGGYANHYANLDTHSYFNALEYRVQKPRVSYRTTAYISMFDDKIFRPDLFGFSGLERYLIGRALRLSVGLEYLSNKSGYRSKLDYVASFVTSGVLHDPIIFLKPEKMQKKVISNLSDGFMATIRHIFKLVAGLDLPSTISINLLSKDEMEKEHSKHSRIWSDQIQGFAINRMHLNDISSVFVKENPIDVLLLTIGHEIGHCLSVSNEDEVLEEAKAFAFELAWLKAIHRFDIMGLADSINLDLLKPAQNGVHDVALNFVRRNLYEDEPLEVFRKIVDGKLLLQ